MLIPVILTEVLVFRILIVKRGYSDKRLASDKT